MGRKQKKAPSPETFHEIGDRLLWSRLALKKETQTAFIEGTGIKRNTYSEYETGERRISLDAALVLCNIYELSLDWIYFGRLGTVDDPDLRDAIRDQRAKAISKKT